MLRRFRPRRICPCQTVLRRSGGERETGEGAARAMIRLIEKILASGVKRENLRVNRRQVHGKNAVAIAGQTNKPDLSYVRRGRRYNIEIDTNPAQSLRHENDIIQNKTKDRTYFLIVDKTTGRIKSARVYTGNGGAAQPLKRFRLRESEVDFFSGVLPF